MNKEKKITLGICGGIAAYKACELVRQFTKENFSVHVMMTESAQKFITPLTLQTLSSHPVATNLFDLTEESQIGHIRLADDPGVILIAPASANIIAKTTCGICDDVVTTVLLATKARVVFAPSMNVNMYQNPVTQENISKLKKRGFVFIDPEEGELACGWVGEGRLADPQKILTRIREFF